MELNQECVRYILLYLERNLKLDNHGLPVSISIKNILQTTESMPQFSASDIYLSTTYLLDKKLITIASQTEVSPRRYKLNSITATGYDYLAAVRDETSWNKLKAHFGDITKQSIPQIIAVGSQILLSKML